MAPKPPAKPLPKSKQIIKCAHCLVSMRRDRLEEHTKQYCKFAKKGLLPKEHGAGSRSLVDMLRATPRATGTVPTAASAPSDTGDRQGEKRRHDDVSDDDDQPEPGPSKKARFEQNAVSSDIEKKLDSILSQLSELKLGTETAKHHAKSSARAHEHDETKPTDTEALKTLIQNCKSIKRLCELASLSIAPIEEALLCDACCDDGTILTEYLDIKFRL